MEWDYGEYDGITSAQIRQERPDWDLWRDGCPGGEAFEQVAGRAGRFLETVSESGNPTLIAFSHGHFLRVLVVVFLGLPKAAGARLSLDTAALSVLCRDGDETLLRLWNDTGHLPGLPA